MRTSILVLCLAVPVGAAQAQINFESAVSIGSPDVGGLSFTSLWAADLDGDGRVDLATSSAPYGFTNARWAIHVNRGVLGLERAGELAGALLGFLDVDGDGVPDAALGVDESPPGAALRSLSLRVQRGNGDGSFATGAAIAIVDTNAALSAWPGDFDGDGDTDLVIAWQGGFRPLRNEAGVFTALAAVALEAGDSIGAVLFADGGIRSDLLVLRHATQSVEILAGQADGRFVGLGELPGFGPDDELQRVERAFNLDFDGDGDLDLLVAGTGPTPGVHVVRSLRRSVDGSLAPVATLSETRSTVAYQREHPAQLTDLDGDGRLELAYQIHYQICPYGVGCPGVVRAPGDFSSIKVDAEGQLHQGASFRGGTFVFGDIDGDGRADAIGARQDVVWRRSSAASNQPIDAPTHHAIRTNALLESGWEVFVLGATDADETLIHKRISRAPTRPGSQVECLGDQCRYSPGTTARGGTDSFQIELTDNAGSVVLVEVEVRIDGPLGGGGSPDPLSLAGLLLAAGWSARRRLLRA